MAAEQHSGFWTKETIEIRDGAGNVVVRLDKDGNIYIKGRYLKLP